MNNVEICKQVDYLISERTGVDQIWELIFKYVMPFRAEFFRDSDSQELAKNWRKNRDVFTSAAIEAAQDLVSFIQGSITPSTYQWFHFIYRNPELNRDQAAMEWLETCARITYESLKDSNFEVENSEVITDLVGPAISYLLHEVIEDERGNLEETYFETIPVDEGYFEQDHRGRANRFYREHEWTPAQCLSKYRDKIEEECLKRLEFMDNDPKMRNDKLKIIMAIFPNPENRKNINSARKLAKDKRPFTCRYIIREGLYDSSTATKSSYKNESAPEAPTLYESGHYEFPVYVPRYRKTSKSKFGNGPSHYALANILSANRWEELGFRAGEKAIDPAILATRRALLSDLDLTSGALTVVAALDQIAPFESKARFDVSENKASRLDMSIREAYFASQLRLKQSPASSATEANINYELMQRLMGPTSNRFIEDYLSMMLQRQFNINFRYGRFPEPPETVRESGAQLDIKYISPMAKAQQAELIGGIERWIGNIAAIMEAFPDARYAPNIMEMIKELRMLSGIPAKLQNSDNDIALEKQKDKEMQERAQIAEVSTMESQAKMAQKQAEQPIA